MKRLSLLFLALVSVLLFAVGCSGEQSSDVPKVNSGVVDENYAGDPDPVLVENYKQTEAEAKALEELIEQIDEEELLGEGGLSTY